MSENMNNKDHDALIRIETKLDVALSWIKTHETLHLRGRLLIWGVLLAAVVGCVVAM